MFMPMREASRLLKIPVSCLENIRKHRPDAYAYYTFLYSPRVRKRCWQVQVPDIKDYMLRDNYYAAYLRKKRVKPDIVIRIDSPRPPKSIADYKDFLKENYTKQYEESYAR